MLFICPVMITVCTTIALPWLCFHKICPKENQYHYFIYFFPSCLLCHFLFSHTYSQSFCSTSPQYSSKFPASIVVPVLLSDLFSCRMNWHNSLLSYPIGMEMGTSHLVSRGITIYSSIWFCARVGLWSQLSRSQQYLAT